MAFAILASLPFINQFERLVRKLHFLEVAKRPLGRRVAVLAVCLAGIATAIAAIGGPSAAYASNEVFCEFVLLQHEEACKDPYFRLITRVNVKSINEPLCAGAHNSNGVEVGGWACSTEGGEASNGNYDGTLYLKGMVYNPSPPQYTGHGLEYYNP